MPVYLGKRNVGIGIVSTINNSGVEINNEDITITENGVYNASEGYTGLGTVTVNVENTGGGSTKIIVKKFNGVANGITPDNNGIVKDFYPNNSLTFDADITNGCVMYFKIKTGNDISRFQNFYLGLFEGYISDNKLALWIGHELALTTVNYQTTYYIKVRIENSSIYASYSMDGVSYSEEVSGEIDLNAPAQVGNTLGQGLYSSRYFSGEIDLNGTYIEKDSEILWKPYNLVKKIDGYLYDTKATIAGALKEIQLLEGEVELGTPEEDSGGGVDPSTINIYTQNTIKEIEEEILYNNYTKVGIILNDNSQNEKSNTTWLYKSSGLAEHFYDILTSANNNVESKFIEILGE